MRTLLFSLSIFIGSICNAQCMGDSIVSAKPDSLYVGDTLNLTVWYDFTGSSSYSDSIFLSMNYTPIQSFLYTGSDIVNLLKPNGYGNLTSKIVIPNNSSFDTSYTKVFIYLMQNNGCGASQNNPRKYIYVRNKPTGIQEITGTNFHVIKEVCYYMITGQLYGTFAHKQTNLPSIPLIEEVIYIDNSVTTRELLHL